MKTILQRTAITLLFCSLNIGCVNSISSTQSTNNQWQQLAINQEKARIILNMLDSQITFYQKRQAPLLTELLDRNRLFIAIQTSCIIRRRTWQYFKESPEMADNGLEFKLATLDPHHYKNKANAFEQRLINNLQNSKGPGSEGTTVINDQQTYYYAKPMKTTKKCLRCHGKPQDAPQDIREIYGTEDGYNWPLDNINSIKIIYIPMG